MTGRNMHLLLPWPDWTLHNRKVATIKQAEKYVAEIALHGLRIHIRSPMPPRLTGDIEGGSVYFVRDGVAMFRAPFAGVVKPRQGDGGAIVVRPELIRVEPRDVENVRGWRYMRDADAPADMPAHVGTRVRRSPTSTHTTANERNTDR